MDTTEVLRQLAIIVLAAKFFGLLARKIKAPMVVGEIIAGLIIGPSMLGLLQSSDFLQGMAEIIGQVLRNVLLADNLSADGVVDIMIVVGNLVGKPYDLPLKR